MRLVLAVLIFLHEVFDLNLRLTALPLAAGLLLSPLAVASVHPHRHSSTHAVVRRSAASHGGTHIAHAVEHASYSGISSERASEIQGALIQRGYLTGEPTGTWDSSSISAMQKLQSDNGWQTKFVPDSRALIKLGLGAGSASAAAVPAAVASSAATADTHPNEQTF